MSDIGLLGLFPLIFCLSVFFSFLGIGGASIYVPLFYWLGFDLLVAIPMALLINMITAASASINYLRKKATDLHTALPVLFTAIIGAPIGAYFARILPEETLLTLFSIVLIATGLLMIRSKEGNREMETIFSGKKIVIGSVLGFIIGIIAGLLGLGGGVFLVPLLLLLGYGVHKAPATSMLIVMFSSASGFFAHISEINLEIRLIVTLCLAAFAGSQIGSRLMYMQTFGLNNHLKTYFRNIFGMFLLIVAFLLQYQKIF